MKNLMIMISMCFSQLAIAQIQSQKPIIVNKLSSVSNAAINGMEVIKIPLAQPPLLHSDGGWEKGPSQWTAAKKFPIDYRGGLLFLDRKANGSVRYLSAEVLFKADGSIEISANSMGNSVIGLHPFKRVFGKKGERKSVTIITTEAAFGTEINIYLKDFKPYKPTQVN